MANRKKMLKKGIESLQKQIDLHKYKQRNAEEEGNIELVGYYEKEIGNLSDVKKEKERLLEKGG